MRHRFSLPTKNILTSVCCRFVACQQSLIEPELVDGAPRVHINDPAFWETLREVASDPVVNVRIAVARLAGNVCCTFTSFFPSLFRT